MLCDDRAIGIVMPLASQVGGAEALLQHLLRCSAGQVRYVCAFLEDGPLVEQAMRLGYDTVVFPTTHLRHVGNYLATLRSLRRWAADKQLRAVVSWMPKAHLYTGVAALALGIPVLWFQHGVPHGGTLDRLTTAVPARGILCCSATASRAQGLSWPHRETYVCYPGVPLSAEGPISRQTARAQLHLPQHAPVVGMVSRMERWKGVHVFVEAAGAILERHPEALLFVVGGPHALAPEYAAEIREQVSRLRHADRFLLPGQRQADEIALWQAAADVIVHPATGIEPFGMAVVEAMTQAKPVIATRQGGPAEIIEDEQSGLLIEPGRAEALAKAVGDLLDDPSACQRLGLQARIRAQTFSDEIFAKRFRSILFDVMR